MKVLYNSILFVFFIALVTSCYKEETLNTTIDKVQYEILDSDDALDHNVFAIYSRYRSVIRYDYDTTEYQWNMVKSLMAENNVLTVKKQKNRDILLKGVKFINEVFFKAYSGKLDKKWMPFKILLAEKIDEEKQYEGTYPNLKSYSGLNYIMIGNVKEGIDKLTESEIKEMKEAIHGEFWGNYLYGNERISMPDSFFEVSNGKYDYSISDPYKEGFWYSVAAWGDNYGPNERNDVKQFFGKIASTPYPELKPILDENKKLKDKYDILINYIKVNYGVDIQAIGNVK